MAPSSSSILSNRFWHAGVSVCCLLSGFSFASLPRPRASSASFRARRVGQRHPFKNNERPQLGAHPVQMLIKPGKHPRLSPREGPWPKASAGVGAPRPNVRRLIGRFLEAFPSLVSGTSQAIGGTIPNLSIGHGVLPHKGHLACAGVWGATQACEVIQWSAKGVLMCGSPVAFFRFTGSVQAPSI